MLFKAPMSETDHPDRNRRKLYGRRKGPKLSERQAGLRRTLLGELAYVPGGDPLQQFPNSVKEVWLEVGFGAGEHLVWQAAHHPEVGMIGAEPYEMGMAKLLTKLELILPQLMNLKPRGIREHLDLNKPIFARTSAYGHFGREPDAEGGFSWEKTDLADKIAAAL